MSKINTINVPDFGEFDEVEVIEICVSPEQKPYIYHLSQNYLIRLISLFQTGVL